MICALKDEGKGVTKRLIRAEPYELVWPRLDCAAKLIEISVADSGVETVTGNYYVCVGKSRVYVVQFNFLLEMQINAQLSRTFVQ